MIAAGSERGSVPVTSTTAAPADRAVSVTAAIDADDVPDAAVPVAGTRTASRLSGAGARVAGRDAGFPTTFTPGSAAASLPGQAAGSPSVSTATGWNARAEAASWARDLAVSGEASSSGACAALASAAATRTAWPAVADTTTTGALANSTRANAAVSAPGAVSARTESAVAGARVTAAGSETAPARSVAAAVAGLA